MLVDILFQRLSESLQKQALIDKMIADYRQYAGSGQTNEERSERTLRLCSDQLGPYQIITLTDRTGVLR